MLRLGLVLVILISALACATPIDVVPDAKAFASRKGLDPNTVECVNIDSDQDGYVSCSAANAAGLVAFECHKYGHGCRPTVDR